MSYRPSQITLLFENQTDLSVTIAVGKGHYEYLMSSPSDLATGVRLMQRWPWKGFNFIKKRAKEVRNVA